MLTAAKGSDALDLVTQSGVDCMILDLEMPGMDGFEVLRALNKQGSEVPVIVYTGTGDYDRCIQAVQLGAYGFIDKAEPMERVVQEVETVLERKRLRSEVASLQRQLGETSLIGDSAAIRRLREAIARVAPIPSPVLIVGESGSGKELVARDLHRLGPGPASPFVAINCAALPESLVESELFGHERGAFTGAASTRKGAFESAERGTLFLDEIGELPLPAQAKLLRVLEERKVTRLGGNRTDVGRGEGGRGHQPGPGERRWQRAGSARTSTSGSTCTCSACRPCATGCPTFLSWLRPSSPPSLNGSASGPRRLSADALELLMGYDWRRNNVRELRNIIERMIIAADGEVLRPEHVPVEIQEQSQVRARPASGSATSTHSRSRPSARSWSLPWSGTTGTSPAPPKSWAWPTTRACSRSCAGWTSKRSAEAPT